MFDARSFAAIEVIDGKLLVSGGCISESINLDSSELYDPKSNQWSLLMPMNGARSGFTMIRHESSLYAMGYLATIERYDIATNHWGIVSSLHMRSI